MPFGGKRVEEHVKYVFYAKHVIVVTPNRRASHYLESVFSGDIRMGREVCNIGKVQSQIGEFGSTEHPRCPAGTPSGFDIAREIRPLKGLKRGRGALFFFF